MATFRQDLVAENTRRYWMAKAERCEPWGDGGDDCGCSCEHCWPSAENQQPDAGDARWCPNGHNHR